MRSKNRSVKRKLKRRKERTGFFPSLPPLAVVSLFRSLDAVPPISTPKLAFSQSKEKCDIRHDMANVNTSVKFWELLEKAVRFRPGENC